MIVLLDPDVSRHQIDSVCRMLTEAGFGACHWREPECAVVGAVGSGINGVAHDLACRLERVPGVERVTLTNGAYPLVSRSWKPGRSAVRICEGLYAGGEELVIFAGPCSVEGRDQLTRAAREVRDAGANVLRGGAFKPRTSPHSFQGLGMEGLSHLRAARELTGLPVVTEVMDTRDLDVVEAVADVLQIGSRNMQNYALLKAVGQTRKPVLLKRAMSATVDEWLQAAEYVLCGGNPRVILCERGIRTFEPSTRFTLDLNAIPLLKRLTHLPVIVDPSHGTGQRDLVSPMSLAAVAAGADGLIVEVHPTPDAALSDGAQSLTCEQFRDLVGQIAPVARAVGRRLRSGSAKPAAMNGSQ